MTEIPEDICEKAKSCRDAYNNDAEWFLAKTAVRHIARAILAERERCAQIADEQVFDDHALAQAAEFGRGCHDAASRIASTIRSPERAGE